MKTSEVHSMMTELRNNALHLDGQKKAGMVHKQRWVYGERLALVIS
jgi:hypothetical protein